MNNFVSFPSGNVEYILDGRFGMVAEMYPERDVVYITDSNIASLHKNLFSGKKVVVVEAGEHSKNLDTIHDIVSRLISFEANRKTLLVGVGGGVVTDITGFVASVFMRGILFGFVPTTVLGMVDASIGGKNGVNHGLLKNMIGTVAQPKFLLLDMELLQTLPREEWSNGFAEIIKYACLFDAELFGELERHDLSYYIAAHPQMQALIQRCIDHKNKTVLADERENGVRKLLNFGHTAGHAIENLYDLPHGKAVAIGMMVAAKLSEGFSLECTGLTQRLKKLLTRYELPHSYPVDVARAMELMKMDKKRTKDKIEFILLERIGSAGIQELSFDTLENAIALCKY